MPPAIRIAGEIFFFCLSAENPSVATELSGVTVAVAEAVSTTICPVDCAGEEDTSKGSDAVSGEGETVGFTGDVGCDGAGGVCELFSFTPITLSYASCNLGVSGEGIFESMYLYCGILPHLSSSSSKHNNFFMNKLRYISESQRDSMNDVLYNKQRLYTYKNAIIRL